MNNTVYVSVLLFLSLSCTHNALTTKRVENIIHQMTLKEKIEFIGGDDGFNIRPYKKYGIPEIRMSDGPVGIRNNGPSTAFPASINLAATWDTSVARKVGQAIGVESKSKNIHFLLAPSMNIYRAAFCGRNFQYLSEDPFLAGEIASTYITGVQSEGVAATAEILAANNMEYNKVNISSDMDERTLREIYLPAFKACVEKGHVSAVMTAYNKVNGVHCSQNDFLINQVLKKEWGFDGVVISDWGSTHNGLAAAKAGLDLEMPSGQYMNADTLLPAIADGRLREEVINEKVRRILMLYERFHFFDRPDIGFNKDSEGEGMDRTYEMPDEQDNLIEDIASVNKNCIVVVNAGGNVQMNWIDQVAGLIYAWYPGEVGNTAVAEIIFGSVNPSGKLPVSFEKRWEDSPVFDSYYNKPGEQYVKYSEGIFLGYRHFDNSYVKPLFPFGFGLSYTSFEYSDIKVNKEKISKEEGLEVTFTLANTGKYDGAEITQLYVSENKPQLPRPVKELKGFSKTFLRKGTNTSVIINLDKSALSYFNKEKGGWITDSGKFKILIGSSSENIQLEKEIEIN